MTKLLQMNLNGWIFCLFDLLYMGLHVTVSFLLLLHLPIIFLNKQVCNYIDSEFNYSNISFGKYIMKKNLVLLQ